MHRRRAAALVLALLLAACSTAGQQPPAAGTRSATSGTSRPSPDPNTAVALVRIAQAFNNSYDHNSDGPVYDRWPPAARPSSPAPNTSDGTPKWRSPPRRRARRGRHTGTTRRLARPLRNRRSATYRLLVLPAWALAVRPAAQQPRRRPALPPPLHAIRRPDRLHHPLGPRTKAGAWPILGNGAGAVIGDAARQKTVQAANWP